MVIYLYSIAIFEEILHVASKNFFYFDVANVFVT